MEFLKHIGKFLDQIAQPRGFECCIFALRFPFYPVFYPVFSSLKSTGRLGHLAFWLFQLSQAAGYSRLGEALGLSTCAHISCTHGVSVALRSEPHESHLNCILGTYRLVVTSSRSFLSLVRSCCTVWVGLAKCYPRYGSGIAYNPNPNLDIPCKAT